MKVYETSQICTNVLASGPNQEEQKEVEKEYIMVDPVNIEMQLERLLSQLNDIKEMQDEASDDLSPEEIEEIKQDTMV